MQIMPLQRDLVLYELLAKIKTVTYFIAKDLQHNLGSCRELRNYSGRASKCRVMEGSGLEIKVEMHDQDPCALRDKQYC